jgi:RNA polymerase sigma factor (sigma-70 family)
MRIPIEVEDHRVLGKTEERKLLKIAKKELKRHKSGKVIDNERNKRIIDARKTLVECNLKLVMSVVKNYHPGESFEPEDYFQEAVVSLYHTIEKFDLKSPWRFSTYASWWMKSYLQRASAFRDKFVRNKFDGNGKAVKIFTRFEYIEETIVDDCSGPEKTDFGEVTRYVKKLALRHQRILELRYINGLTLEQTGKIIGVTRERIRQIEEVCFRKIAEWINNPDDYL